MIIMTFVHVHPYDKRTQVPNTNLLRGAMYRFCRRIKQFNNFISEQIGQLTQQGKHNAYGEGVKNQELTIQSGYIEDQFNRLLWIILFTIATM